jgi:hypothetical protein
MMPAVRAVVSNSDSHLMSPSGHLFPPFIIVERGEVRSSAFLFVRALPS